MELRLYNTLGRTKEAFSPADGKMVRMYSCGPTVYSNPHIGNLRAYLFVDTLRRALTLAGFPVRLVMNITDVGHLTSDADEGEDKLEKAAREQKQDAYALAAQYTAVFRGNLKELNIQEPDIWAKATDHIPEQIALVQKIEAAGYTYTTSDGVYFDTGKLKDYGVLAQLDMAGLKEGARVEKNAEKRNPTDFALWKFSPKEQQRQMEWDSPWGKGFPGWHLECTAMSVKYLGELADIHTGGVDHIPTHHTNEIAQSQAAYGSMEARFWMHNEHVLIAEGRMGKSEGNMLTLAVLKEEGYSPLAYRYFVLGTHYRQKINFSWDAMDGAQAAYEKLVGLVQRLSGAAKIGCAEFEGRLRDAMADDLNTPQALAILWEMLKSDYPDSAKKKSLEVFDAALGLGLADIRPAADISIPQEVQKLLSEREKARADKDFAKADAVRKKIEKAGFTLEDTPDGPRLISK